MVVWSIFDFQAGYGKIWSSLKALETCRMILAPGNWVWDQQRGCPIPHQLATQTDARRELLKDRNWCSSSALSLWCDFLGKSQFQKSFNQLNILDGLPPGLRLKPLSKQTTCAFTLSLLPFAFPLLAHRLVKTETRTHLHRQLASSPSPTSNLYVPLPQSI